jgi:hypothetical protein
MDDRFPRWLRTFVRKLDFLGIPNLGPLVCAMMVLAVIAQMTGAPYERFLFDPERVLAGEWWRIFAFPLPQGLDPLFLILYVMYSYFIITSVEGQWGAGPTTIFILLSYLAGIAAAFITGLPVSIWNYILQNVGLAFGTLFPDFEILLFFVLPVKAKWIAVVTGVVIAYSFLIGGMESKIIIGVTILPYLIFFGPMLIQYIRMRGKVAKNRRRFDQDMWR